MPDPTSVEHDLRAIHALNQRHIDAVMSNDLDTVMSLWSDDFTVIPPVGPIVRGGRANAAIVQQGRDHVHAFEPVEAVEDFEEIKVVGDYAFEWGTYRWTSRPRAGGEPVSAGGKLLRILQRHPDGSWKMYRTIATTDPPAR
jgi:ketosteroid isomerase-like protein